MRAARSRLLFLVGLSYFALGCSDPRTARYRAAVDEVRAAYGFPGALVSVALPGNATWREAFGQADLASQAPLTLDMHFPIRSVTKSFTVTVLLQLVREGTLSLADPIGKYVSGIPNGDQITLADLAEMQSGIADYSSSQGFQTDFAADLGRSFTDEQLVAYAIPTSPVFAPGERYQYSNTNTVLLGMVIAKVTGAPLGDAFAARLYGPLHLVGSAYPTETEPPAPHPSGYAVFLDGSTAPAQQPFISPSSLAGAGGMVSTIADLEAWGRALGEGDLVGPALQAERLARRRPATNGPEYDLYGLGIGQIHGWWGHTGSGVGFQLATMHDPTTKATIAVMVNATPAGGRRDLNFAQELFEALAAVVTAR